jgi:hypothetical protein
MPEPFTVEHFHEWAKPLTAWMFPSAIRLSMEAADKSRSAAAVSETVRRSRESCPTLIAAPIGANPSA